MFKCRLYDICLCPVQAGQIQKKDFHYPKYSAVEVSDLRVKTSPYFKSCMLNLRLSFECVCVCVCVYARARVLSHSVMSDSLRPHGLQPPRLLCPWDSPGKNPGVGCHFLLQGIFPIQGLNPRLLHSLHWQQIPHPSAVWLSVKEFYRASRIPVTQSNVLTYPYVHCQAMRRKDRTVGSYSKLLTKTISY